MLRQINKSNVEHDGAAFTTQTVDFIFERLEQAATMNLVALPHTFIPTEMITIGTVTAGRARLHSLRCARENHAQDARDSFHRWNEAQEAERQAAWTLDQQQKHFNNATLLSNRQE